MALFTKCITDKVSKKDGLRICIMVRPDEGMKYDIWMPELAPTNQQLSDLHNGKISKKELFQVLNKKFSNKSNKHIKNLVEKSEKENVTLLCWEKNPNDCHRKIIADVCKKLDSNLEVKIK